MGENINLERIREAAVKMGSKLEKQHEESRNKEKNLELQYAVQTMTKEDIERELDKSKGIYDQISYSIDNKKNELRDLKQNKAVKKYITLMSQVEDFEKEKKHIADKVSILEQAICNHDILYLMTYPKKAMSYFPTFRCVCCGKGINGFIDEEQVVINKDFLDENEDSLHGNLTEYLTERYRYFELLEVGESEEEIIVELQDELHQKHNGKKNTVKLLTKKREDN